MTYFQFDLDHPKEEAASRFVADVGRALQEALVARKGIEHLSQKEIAERLGVNRSAVNRCFSGYRNLSLETLAELCWAMDVEPTLHLEQLLAKDNGNFPCFVKDTEVSRPEPSTRSSNANAFVRTTDAVKWNDLEFVK